ncbi:DUF2231 domain-containing protein [Fibrella arboris]|uniref:DUF2231 domain-containing protein n=1 Tax=Fibrella arboris TaxID=3242486 RepID=UPI00352164B7
MESKAKVLGHALHPILIVFPLGLLSTSVLFDVAHLLTDSRAFALVAFWTVVGGILGGLVAAVPGWIDWLAIPAGTRAKRIGLIHGLGNVMVLLLFSLSWLIRRDENAYLPTVSSLSASFAGFAILGITGWLGGELVDRLGVGVDDHANLNAPSSLSGYAATDINPVRHTIH